MTSSNRYRAIVKCPFCGVPVDSRELADHARSNHVTEKKEIGESHPGTDPVPEGIELLTPVYVPGMRHTILHESGSIVSPRLVREDLERNRGKRAEGVTRRGGQKQFHTSRKKRRPVAPSWSGRCPVCERAIRKMSMQEHLAHAHSIQADPAEAGTFSIRAHHVTGQAKEPGSGLAWCPHCTARVKPAKLQKHLAMVHPDAKPAGKISPEAQSKPQVKKQAGNQKQEKTPGETTSLQFQ